MIIEIGMIVVIITVLMLRARPRKDTKQDLTVELVGVCVGQIYWGS